MTQRAFEGDIAYDWELWIGRQATPGTGDHEWTQIYGFVDLPYPEQVPEEVDVTHMQSPGRTRETIPGMLPVADWSQDKQLWPDNEGDELLEELSDLTADGEKENILVEFNVDPDGTAIRRTYAGYVNSYTPNGTVGDVAMANLSMKIMARQADNDRTIEP